MNELSQIKGEQLEELLASLEVKIIESIIQARKCNIPSGELRIDMPHSLFEKFDERWSRLWHAEPLLPGETRRAMIRDVVVTHEHDADEVVVRTYDHCDSEPPRFSVRFPTPAL